MVNLHNVSFNICSKGNRNHAVITTLTNRLFNYLHKYQKSEVYIRSTAISADERGGVSGGPVEFTGVEVVKLDNNGRYQVRITHYGEVFYEDITALTTLVRGYIAGYLGE